MRRVLLGIVVFLVSPPRLHPFEQGLFRLVEPRRRVIADFHVAERPRKVHVEMHVEGVGDVDRQLRQGYVAETTLAVEQVDQFRQIRLRVLPRRAYLRQRQSHVPVVRVLQRFQLAHQVDGQHIVGQDLRHLEIRVGRKLRVELVVECFEVLLRVGLPAQEVKAVQVRGPAAEIADKVEALLRVGVDGPDMGVQVLPLCPDTAHRTVHLDVVELAVIDQTAEKTGLDFLEEGDLLIIAQKVVADDILFQTVERFSQDT